MSFTRDLAWQYLGFLYKSSVTYHFARYALALNYELLPKDVVHQAKRCLLDALGCAIGAYDAPGRPICEAMASELGGPEEATVFASGTRTSVLNATLVNSFMARYLDANDIGGGGHNNESIPGILAVSEREKVGGRDFLTSLVISYELGARVSESMTRSHKFVDVRGGLSMPPALGKLMGLNEEQIANAIGICASHSLPLGILDTNKVENTMTKNLRFGFVVYNAILACMLAKKGFTGPIDIVEGENGFREVIAQGDMSLERLIDFSGWRILKTRFKCMSANGSSIPHVLATLAIVKENNLKAEDIAAVRIRANAYEAPHTGTQCLAKKYPRNGESADHSAFYLNAIAIKEQVPLGPASYKPEKFTDPIVLDLIEKITVEYDPSLGNFGGVSEIITKDGRRFQKRIDNLHGFGDDPLSDKELEEKFWGMASKYMSEGQIKKIIDTVWNLESLEDMSQLTRLMTFGYKV